ncbi:MAG TPA: hypothetical protein DFR83_20735, partial [Deltaproteobacteria bacterium]|nr:hypothetical protein [Deltaproteobacteria bacterium]
EELVDPPTYEHSDPEGLIESGAADTQIMQVIGSGDNRRLAPVAGPVHEVPGATKRGPVDLRAWRAEHGVVPSREMLDAPTRDALGDFDDEGFLEEEDEDVVVMTRQEEPAHDPRTPVIRRSSISVIEKVPEPPPPIPNLPGQDEDTPTMGLSPALPEFASSVPTEPVRAGMASGLPEDPDESVELEPVDPVPGPAARTSWVALASVAMVLLLLFSGLLGVVFTRQWIATTQSANVRAALLDSHPDVLLPLRSDLRQMHRSGGILAPAQSQVASSLILVDLALWEVVSGDPSTLNEALALAEDGMAGPDSKLAMAWIDRVVGNPVSFERLGNEPLVALLRAEEAIDAGRWEAAAEAIADLPQTTGVRVVMADVRVREQAGAVALDTLPASFRNHPLGQIWMYGGGDQALSDRERIGLLKGLAESLPKEAAWLRAQTLVAEARINSRSGRAEAAAASWREALKVNPTDALVIAHVAATSRKPSRSLKLVRDCLQLVQSSPACQRGLVQIQLELGNRTEAVAQVDAWRNAGIGVGLLADWVMLESEDRSHRAGAPQPSDPHRASYGLTRYLDALSQDTESARRAGLRDAIESLRAGGHPWDIRLAAHIYRQMDVLVQVDPPELPPGG